MAKRRVLPLILAALMLCLATAPAAAAAESATAATMQLMKTEGTVNVTSSSGRSLTKRDNMRLYNGYHVETKAKSYAWINLDNSKLIKLDAVSEAEVRKSGKALELLLSSGSFFFNVTSPLKEEETLNIRTATMVVGIRGTSGWFKTVDQWSTEIYVLEGTVQCSVSDPVTGEAKEATIQSGEMAVATAYPQDREGDKCGIVQERFEPEDIDGFVLEELAQNPGLCADILEKSGLDVMSVTEATQERREQDERKMQDTLNRIEDQLAEQDNNTSAGPVWGQEDSASNRPDNSTDFGSGDAGGGGSGSNSGGSGNTEPALPTAGRCGDNLTWTLDDEGKLIINGTGDMYNYTVNTGENPAPWAGSRAKIKTVEIADGVTSIGTYAFSSTALTEVTIPNHVETVGELAFFDCKSLNKLNIGTDVKRIGDGAFSACTALTNVTIPDNVEAIGRVAFYQCIGLKELIIGTGVMSIGEEAFSGCTELKIVSYGGDREHWEKIAVGGGNEPLINAVRCTDDPPAVGGDDQQNTGDNENNENNDSNFPKGGESGGGDIPADKDSDSAENAEAAGDGESSPADG